MDTGADTNFVPPTVFKVIQKTGASIKVAMLLPPTRFEEVTARHLLCVKKLTMDLNHKIGHGINLIFRNIMWNVSMEDVDNVIIGRHLLAAICL